MSRTSLNKIDILFPSSFTTLILYAHVYVECTFFRFLLLCKILFTVPSRSRSFAALRCAQNLHYEAELLLLLFVSVFLFTNNFICFTVCECICIRFVARSTCISSKYRPNKNRSELNAETEEKKHYIRSNE